MGARRILCDLFSVLLLVGAFLSSAKVANATSDDYPLRVKVLSAETHSLKTGTPVPKNCDMVNFDAYCNESKNPTSESTMVVVDDRGKSYRIMCTTDSRWSKCAPLPIGETFDARNNKRGMTIVYHNAKGKEEKETYKVVADVTGSAPSLAPAPQTGLSAEPQPAAPAAPQVPPVQPPAPSAPTHSATPAAAGRADARQYPTVTIKCDFTSTPQGAEITLDGKYVGSTPSQVGLSPGTHVVLITMPGFAEWKRELWVAPDSVLNVTAILQKTQP